MKSELVSIIVPVYNVEQYLKRCIDSILLQTYQNIELILVNDGSTDESGRLCEVYSGQDRRIKLIHQKNKGLSGARNTGMRHATGKYIYFVDSDDYLERDAIEVMVDAAENFDLDILAINAIRETEDTKTKYKTKEKEEPTMDGVEYLYRRIKFDYFIAPVWLYFFNGDFLRNCLIDFKEGILCEDENWTPQVIIKAKKIRYFDKQLYHYIYRPNSIINDASKNQRKCRNIIDTCYDLEVVYSSVPDKNKRKILLDYLVRMYMGTARYYERDLIPYKALVDKRFLIKNSHTLETFLKLSLYMLSKKTYIKLKGR